MDIKEFTDQHNEATQSSDVPVGATGLLMVTRQAAHNCYYVTGSMRDIELEPFNRIYILSDPPTLAKDLKHGQVFRAEGARYDRCRVEGHVSEKQGHVYAPYLAPTTFSDWINPDAPCTIVKGGE